MFLLFFNQKAKRKKKKLGRVQWLNDPLNCTIFSKKNLGVPNPLTRSVYKQNRRSIQLLRPLRMFYTIKTSISLQEIKKH